MAPLIMFKSIRSVPEIPTIDNWCEKESFAFFGLAAYYAQVLEEAALNLAVVLRLTEVNLISQELFLDLYDSLSDGGLLDNFSRSLNQT